MFSAGNILKGGGMVAALGLATGLAFLPGNMVDAAAGAVFGWLPEEQRGGACAVTSSSSCACCCVLIVLLVVVMVMRGGGGGNGGNGGN